MKPLLKNYEFVFTGRHISEGYKLHSEVIIEDFDMNSAKLKLIRDFVTIKIHYSGIANHELAT